MGKTLGVTGRRPKYFPWRYDENDSRCQNLKKMILSFIVNKITEGYDTFVSGMALGSDMYFAEAVLEARKFYPRIRLIGEIPFQGQANKWLLESRNRYDTIKKEANELDVLYENYDSKSFLARDKRIVDRSDELLVIWEGKKDGGTYHTYEMAEKAGKPTTVIDYTKIEG